MIVPEPFRGIVIRSEQTEILTGDEHRLAAIEGIELRENPNRSLLARCTL